MIIIDKPISLSKQCCGLNSKVTVHSHWYQPVLWKKKNEMENRIENNYCTLSPDLVL